jgi:hypothetical protein
MLVLKTVSGYVAYKTDEETEKLLAYLGGRPHTYVSSFSVQVLNGPFIAEEYEDETGNLRTIRELREEIAALKGAISSGSLGAP